MTILKERNNTGVEVTWSVLKAKIDSGISFSYTINIFDNYKVYLVDQSLYLFSEIIKETPVVGGSDQEDFENNYLANAKKVIVPDVYSTNAVRVFNTKIPDSELPSNLGTTPTTPTYVDIGNTVWTPLISIRIKSTFPSSQVIISNIGGAGEGNGNIVYQIVKNPTLTGASWVDSGTIVEYDISSTSLSGGSRLTQFLSNSTFKYAVDSIRVNSDDVGSSDIITITARSFKQNDASYAVINYEVV